MTIHNTLGVSALVAAAAAAASFGLDWFSDFTATPVQPPAFDSSFIAPPVGVAFESDFVAGTYQVRDAPESYGAHQIDDQIAPAGDHYTGLPATIVRDGFDSDFVVWYTPQTPAGYTDETVYSDFTDAVNVAETSPPPVAFDSDFTLLGVAVDSDFVTGLHRATLTAATSGLYTTDDRELLSGTPVPVPQPFSIDQALPGTFADDRLGYFVLGYTILGADAL